MDALFQDRDSVGGMNGDTASQGTLFGTTNNAGLDKRNTSEPLRTCAAVHNGPLSKSIIREIITEQNNNVRSCYESELSKLDDSSEFETDLLYKLIITRGGALKEVELLSSSSANEALESCVLEVIKSLAFPCHQGSQLTIVHWPYRLRVQN